MLSDTVLGWWHLRGGWFGPRCLRCTRGHRDRRGFRGGRSTRAIRCGWGTRAVRRGSCGGGGRGGGGLAPTAAAAGACGLGPGGRHLAVGLLGCVRLSAVRRG